MLKKSFIHVSGIGAATEQRLWQAGIEDWDSLLERDLTVPISAGRRKIVLKEIEKSQQSLKGGNPLFFSSRLPANQTWRLFPEFRDAIVYLDIETTGLEKDHCEITTIATYDGQSVRTYVQGGNLDDFISDIQQYGLIVTYNGKSFDVPFIESCFGSRLDHAQIDLRYVLGSLGYKGGLKACERQLGMDRGDLSGVDGFFAVLLWQDYRRTGNRKALDTLLAYNVQDAINLERLMVTAYNLKIKATPFYDTCLTPLPAIPENPYQADAETVNRIKRRLEYG